jgi:hypothetical protein
VNEANLEVALKYHFLFDCLAAILKMNIGEMAPILIM